MLGLEVIHVCQLDCLKPILQLPRGMQVGPSLLPDFDKGLLNFHGIETIQGIGHPDAAVVAAVTPGN